MLASSAKWADRDFGAMFVGRQGMAAGLRHTTTTGACGLDLGWQTSTNGRVSCVSVTDRFASRPKAGPTTQAPCHTAIPNEMWNNGVGFTQVGDRFSPEVGFLQRRGYRRLELRSNMRYQPKQWPWIRRISPHANYNGYVDLQNRLESSQGHWHFFDIQTLSGALAAM